MEEACPTAAKRGRKGNLSQKEDKEMRSCPEKGGSTPEPELLNGGLSVMIVENESFEPIRLGEEPVTSEIAVRRAKQKASNPSENRNGTVSSGVNVRNQSNSVPTQNSSVQSSTDELVASGAPQHFASKKSSSGTGPSSCEVSSGKPEVLPKSDKVVVAGAVEADNRGQMLLNGCVGDEDDAIEGSSQDLLLSDDAPDKNGEVCDGLNESEELCGESEDPLFDLSSNGHHAEVALPVLLTSEPGDEKGCQMSSPTQGPFLSADGDHTPQSCDTEEAKQQKGGSSTGILKRVSQFDTPCSARQAAGRRVQFASQTDVREVDCNNKGHKVTPIRGMRMECRFPCM